MRMTQYTIAIATRNRQNALALSLPYMIGQSRVAEEIIIVDSSDDHEYTIRTARSALAGFPGRLKILHSAPGLVRQRAIALQETTSPIVLFPDDDSIWHPEVAEEKLKLYDRDTEGRIAAVCGMEVTQPPAGFAESGKLTYKMRLSDRVGQYLGRWRFRVEHWLVPDPARVLGRDQYLDSKFDDWLSKYNACQVEWMTGFRMSFRTEVIRRAGFDQIFSGYSLFEDIDASFSARRYGAIVAARGAKVFHYKAPERREAGRRIGVTQILNKAYVVAKHGQNSYKYFQLMRRYAYYKMAQYALANRGEYGHERYLGSKKALRQIKPFFSASKEDLPHLYKTALEDCIAR